MGLQWSLRILPRAEHWELTGVGAKSASYLNSKGSLRVRGGKFHRETTAEQELESHLYQKSWSLVRAGLLDVRVSGDFGEKGLR